MKLAARQAFTVIELVVAIAVTAVMALFAFQFTRSMVEVWTLSERNLVVETDVQAALDTIAQDLQEAYFAEGQGVMFAVEALSNGDNSGDEWDHATEVARPTEGAYDPASHRYGWAGMWLRFFTAEPTLNAVGYQIVRRPLTWEEDQGPVYQLFRSVVRGDLVAEAGYDLTDEAYVDKSQTLTEGHPVTVTVPPKNNHIVEHVIDFGIRLYVRDADDPSPPEHAPTGMRLIFPAEAGVVSDQNNLHWSVTGRKQGTGDDANWGNRFPEAAEIFLRVLDPDGAEALRRLEEEGGDPAQWEAIAAEHGRLYRRFVDLPTRTL